MASVFAHGQLRLYLMALLSEGPRHGYDVMRALEERFDGMYTPSAGTVYPRLSRLEDEGLVTRTAEGRKTVYALTEAGRAEIERRGRELSALETDLDASVADLAHRRRTEVRGSSRALKAELAAAARAARAEAQAAPRLDGRWAASPLARDVEAAVTALRAEVRAVVRRRGVDEAVVAAVREAVETARRAVREAVDRSATPPAGQ